jgi:hypothetical protein
MDVPNLNKDLAGQVLDLLIQLHQRDGYVNLTRLREIAVNLDQAGKDAVIVEGLDPNSLEDFESSLKACKDGKAFIELYKSSDLSLTQFEEKLKQVKVSELDRLCTMLTLDVKRFTTRSVRASLLIEYLQSH